MSALRAHPPLFRMAAALAVLVLLCAQARPVLAADTYTFTPQVSARETYDSNVNFSGHGDTEHSVAGNLRLDMQKERVGGWIQARGTAYKYSRLNEFDRVDQNYTAGIQVNATEKITVDIQGGVTADHAFSNSLAETGEVARTAAHQVYSLRPSVTLLLDEVNSLTLFYAFGKSVYDSTEYTNYQSHTLGALWGYRLNERTQLLLQLSNTRMESKSAEFNNISAMAGFEYSLAETLKARVLVGASTLKTEYEVGIKRSSNDYSVESSLDWRLEKLNTSAGYSRDMTLGITGDDLVRDRFFLNFYYTLTERFTAILQNNLVLSQGNSSSQSGQDNRWMEIRPSLRYYLAEKAYLEAGYTYAATKDMQLDLLRTRNKAYLEFSASF